MNDSFISFHRPSIGEEEITEVVETLRSGWLTTGPRVARFERDFCERTGAPHAIAVNSATAGLHLALAALEIGPGQEVITTPMTFCATVQAILHVGATPVLADIGSDGNIDPEQIKKRITSRTRAIIPVHMAGLPCDMEAIWALAKQRGINVIEDAAHAAGASYNGRSIGAGPDGAAGASDAVVFSFYATKNLTTGEGGMITTHRPELAQRMRMLALHGVSHDAWDRYTDRGDWRYDVLAHGFKYNMSDIQAAIGIHQLRKLNQFVERRALLASMYHEAFADMDELETPPDNLLCRHAWHLYILRLNLSTCGVDRGEFIQKLKQKGIGASVHFIPIPMLRYFARLPLAQYAVPRARDLFPRIISLPLYPAMTDEQVQYVAHEVREIVGCSKRVRFAAPGIQVATLRGGAPVAAD
ncbi:MAG: DegT/DnrJ/EryC1/StrS family aminotransferase [Bryobacteraceae bacterium]|jgi:dTDP-4-amino-4,6-dideoxygalactose transaminase